MRRVVATLAHVQHAGMLRALRILADAAPRYGWELRYAVPRWTALIETTGLPREHVTVIPGLGRWRRWPERLRLPVTLARLLAAARGADALYSTTLSTFPHCRIAARVLRIPAVVHVYSSYGEPWPYRKHHLGRARHVIAPSADSLRLAEAAIGGFAPGTRARVVYNGMDVARIRHEAEATIPAHGLAGDVPLIGMVGNLDARKNAILLVEATPAIRAAVPDVRVLLVGAFPDAATESTVRGRIRTLGLEDVVRVTGFLPNPFPIVKRLDVLVHPARRDPFPLALLEGMALARPIVASAVGGIPEMLVDGASGRLFAADNAAALASVVIELLRDPARRSALGAAALARLTTEFSLDGFAAGMFAVFDQAVVDGRRP